MTNADWWARVVQARTRHDAAKHDAMEAYERRIGRVQPRPTDSDPRGQKPTSAATTGTTRAEQHTQEHNQPTVN